MLDETGAYPSNSVQVLMEKGGQTGWSSHIRIALVVTSAAFIFAIAYFSPHTNIDSDPRYTLLVSQALIEHRTVRLDTYQATIENQAPVEWRLWRNDGHIYYVYPLAASFLALPLVAALHRLGYDMRSLPNEDFGQNFLSAVTVVFIFLFLYKIARYYLPSKTSLVLAGVSVLGTTLISTLGTAVWSHNFAVLFICLSLWLLVRLENGDPFPGLPYALGLFLFLAYFSRPTTAVFIAATLLFLFFKYRPSFWRTACIALLLLAGFVWFAQREYGLWLPPYYLPHRFGGLLHYSTEETTPFPIAVYALLFSPSRGLFVYSPIFLLAIAGLLHYRHAVKRHSLLWLIAIGSFGHIILVARFPNWWGGFSFGPRLLSEMAPVLALLTIFVARAWLQDSAPRYRRIGLLLFLLAGGISLFIHSYLGLFNQNTLLSHGHSLPPHVDKAPYLLLDWRYPQFLTTPESVCARNKVYFETMLAEKAISLQGYHLGQEIPAAAAGKAQHIPRWAWWQEAKTEEAKAERELTAVLPPSNHTFLPLIFKPPDPATLPAVFIGWLLPGEAGIWSACHTTDIVIGPITPPMPEQQLTLTISARAHLAQSVPIRINGENVGQMTFAEELATPQLVFPAALLHTGQPNVISLDFPDALAVENTLDGMPLGILLQKIVIAP